MSDGLTPAEVFNLLLDGLPEGAHFLTVAFDDCADTAGDESWPEVET